MNMPGYAIEQRAKGHVLCSSFQFASWYPAQMFKFREKCTNIATAHKEWGCKSTESKTVERKPAFYVEA